MRLLNKILSLAASAAIMFTGYSTLASAQTDPASSSEAIADIQNTDVHFVKIAAGWEHSLALDSDGHVWAWGEDYNKLGVKNNGDYGKSTIPVRVNTDVKFVDIAVNDYTSFGIDEEGYLWQWGIKNYGIYGIYNDDHYPERISSDVKFKSLSASYSSLVAVDEDSQIWAWNRYGFNGKVKSEKKFVSVACGFYGVFAVDEEGLPYELIFERKNPQDSLSETVCTPVCVNFNRKVKQVSVGENRNALFLDEDGYLWGKGTNASGAVVDGTYEDRDNFVRVKTDKKFAQISSGNDSSFAISQDGELYSWGYNDYGQLGGGEMDKNPDKRYIDKRNIPVHIMTDKKFKQVSAGLCGTVFAIDEYGISWGWGLNRHGAAGIGNTEYSVSEPARMAINVKFTQISANGNHAAAVDAEGHVWTWGIDEHGESGTMSRENKTGGIVLAAYGSDFSKEKITKVSVGDKHVLALDSNGHVWGWGSNQEGQLVEEKAYGGDWSPTNLFAGTEYADLVFTDIYAGATSSMAVDSNCNTWQWGTGEAETPKSVDSGNDPGMPNTGLNFVQTAVGRDHVLCLDKSGVIWSWGKDDYGQLGRGTYGKFCISGEGDKCQIDVRHLYDVVGRKYHDAILFSQIAAGDGFSVALDTEGRIWTWGRNDKGQLGNYVSASKRETPGYVFR